MDNDLFQSIIRLKTLSQCNDFFTQILSPKELSDIAARYRTVQGKENVRIAIQSKGRLADKSLEVLFSMGIRFNANGRNCLVRSENYPLDILFLRDDDIPRYVARGIADFGIVGQNIVLEQGIKVKTIKRFEFGVCSLVIAIPENSSIKKIQDLGGKRIATSYPNILKKFLKSAGVKASIIQLKGSVEIAPALNLAEAICDLTQTGKTLKENSLKPLISVLESRAILIQTPNKTGRNYEKILQLFNVKK